MSKSRKTICFPFVGNDIGGSHFSAVKLIEALDPKIYNPLVVLHVRDGPVAPYLEERGVPYEVLSVGAPPSLRSQGGATFSNMLSMARFVAGAFPAIMKFLKQHEVDILHTNDGQIHSVWSLPARLAGARHIWHHRGDPDAFGVNYLAPIVSNQIVAVSRFAKPGKPIRNVDRKFAVVHSPFDAPSKSADRAAARAALVEELGCGEDTLLLGYFGSIVPRKRPIAFVEAVAAFLKRHPEVPVMGLLFGMPVLSDPDYDKTVQQRIDELGIGNCVRLMGFRRPIEPYIHAIDIMPVTAVREPFGRTLIEAMYLGTPVVATNDGGNPEAIEDGINGILVPADEPEKFVEPIYKLHSQPDFLERIVKTAKERAYASYGVDVHVKKITGIYEKLLASRKDGIGRHEPLRGSSLEGRK
ncbi:glycosyltransferase family 4 protein [Rhizobiales bacterium]|uniref:glycosyltransferase family 4 protein n=1 Tax=Hongsoonwoonella zoysiae TaxID=2821844 RepID=UPI00155FE040|nr:glycosyltransferase family 4 protein [Hongsoonwoonella zoysiae]NRG18314.1 glycosyltransferase family 4 protein [Hongsoonwoonella zoysiae]